MGIRVGSRVAYCNGYECWLGYAPQMINGAPHVHSLDAQKNLQPLLRQFVLDRKAGRAIAIDPGHGGKDGGTRSVFNGVFEKDYTLDWALRLRALLEGRGWKVALTRSNDLYLSLADRVAVAENAKADFFLSLHFNSGEANQSLAGIETYCLTPAGLPSHLRRSFEDDLRQVYPNNAFDEQNFQFAFGLHRTLLQCTGAADRGVRRARFMAVLRGQNRPAVLIEAGYLTNPAEAQRIALPDYRQTLAEAVTKWLE
jgi:N-acetylmuramoyl-L-alanine amidase